MSLADTSSFCLKRNDFFRKTKHYESLVSVFQFDVIIQINTLDYLEAQAKVDRVKTIKYIDTITARARKKNLVLF